MVNLQAGQVIKNYKELCNILNEPIKTGKSKQIQLKEFERYFSYHKQGNSFIIDEVYAEPKPKVDNRCNNGGHIANTKYDTLMDNIIIDMLLNECEITASFTDMFRSYIPLITETYTDGKIHGFKFLEKQHGISIGLITTYSNKIKDMIKGSFETALNRLQKQGLLYWSSQYIIIKSIAGQDFATEEETEMIKQIEKDTYESMKIKPLMRINPDINKEFRKNVIADLQEIDDDIFGYWKVYHIQADDSIEKIKPVPPNIKELTNRYINSIHEKIMNHKIKDENGKSFQPYKAEKHMQSMLRLDLLFWEQYKGLEHGFGFDDISLELAYYELGNLLEEKPIAKDDEPIKENIKENDKVIWDEETGVYFPF
ncbi:MAG: hypothetical protein AB7E42_02280 [Anaerotignaceae bacterium]